MDAGFGRGNGPVPQVPQRASAPSSSPWRGRHRGGGYRGCPSSAAALLALPAAGLLAAARRGRRDGSSLARGLAGRGRRRLVRLSAVDDDGPWLPATGGWEWGEIYIWGGVTFSPGTVLTPQEELEGELEEVLSVGSASSRSRVDGNTLVRPRVLRAVLDQYPWAWRGGSFAGKPISDDITTGRFRRLREVLEISAEDAAELVEIDATPILVEPEGVEKAFNQIKEVSSRDKALELVRCHPGLLVGGVRSMKEGCGLVTETLVDLFFAGRLLKVLEDNSKDNVWKLREIEHYARVAATVKPVMDLVQREGQALAFLVMLLMPGLFPVLGFACLHTLFHMGLIPESIDHTAAGISISVWLVWFVTKSVEMGPVALGLGDWFLRVHSWLLTVSSSLLAAVLPYDEAQPIYRLLGFGSWLLAVTAGILRDLNSTFLASLLDGS